VIGSLKYYAQSPIGFFGVKKQSEYD